MKKKLFLGFSLMEMMVVLLIVAVVMAASAPMISKKLAKSQETSPLAWVGNEGMAGYNFGARDAGLMIGASTDGLSANHPKLFVRNTNANAPHIRLTDDTTTVDLVTHGGGLGIVSGGSVSNNLGNNSVALGNGANASATNSVAIGYNSAANQGTVYVATCSSSSEGDIVITPKDPSVTCTSEPRVTHGGVAIGANTTSFGVNTVALGRGASANNRSAIAVGSESNASVGLSMALGNAANASANGAIAIGSASKASGNFSVAIGASANATKDHQIVLGTSSSTVYIPGRLVVDKGTVLGRTASNEDVYIRMFEQHSNEKYLKKVGYDNGVLANQGTWLGMKGGPLYQEEYSSGYVSDRRLKNVGKAFKGGLAEIKKLQVFNYTFKKDERKTPRVGVIAQDLQKIFPDAVIKGEDGFLKIRMEDMFYAIVNAIKELDLNIVSNAKRIEALEKQNDIYAKQNADLVKTIEKLEARIAKLEKRK